jgi:hypothetical protein
MPGRLSTLTRGRFIEGIDRVLQKPNEELLRRHESISASDISALGTGIGVAPPEAEGHSENSFFGDDLPKAFFPPGGRIPDSAAKKAIVLSASIQAQRVALYENPDAAPSLRKKRKQPLPVVSYWINGVPDFEVYVTLSSTAAEVHMLILTPFPSEDPKPPSYGRAENIWVIASDDRIKLLHDAMPASFKASAPFDIKGAQCQKLIDY